MRNRRVAAHALALAAVTAATVGMFPAGAASGGTRNDSLVTFTPATVVDPILFGGEPGLNFDPTTSTGSRSFVDWPVSSRQNIGVVFRSQDGGLTYQKRYADPTDPAEAGPLCTGRQIPTCGGGGGGDTDVNVAEDGTVYFSSQESLADQLMGTSFDSGTTFPADHVDPVVSKCGPVDRQWITHWKGTKTVFLAYHIPAVGECINRSDDGGKTGSWSIPQGPQIPFVTQSGAILADNTGGIHNKALYVAYLGGNTALSSGFTVAVSTDGAKTFVKPQGHRRRPRRELHQDLPGPQGQHLRDLGPGQRHDALGEQGRLRREQGGARDVLDGAGRGQRLTGAHLDLLRRCRR